jgi:hypothetical protein
MGNHTPQRYTKRPVTIDAMQWDGTNADAIKAFTGTRDNGESRFLEPAEISGTWDKPHVYDELQGEWIPVNDNDWIIRGIRGEFYPCAADVFAATYDVEG